MAARLSVVVLGVVLALAALSAHTEAGRAFFVFGDSLVDNGNNNYLATTARADSYPYGIDFPTHRPTGRFSNGLNIPDYISWVHFISFLSLRFLFFFFFQFNLLFIFLTRDSQVSNSVPSFYYRIWVRSSMVGGCWTAQILLLLALAFWMTLEYSLYVQVISFL